MSLPSVIILMAGLILLRALYRRRAGKGGNPVVEFGLWFIIGAALISLAFLRS